MKTKILLFVSLFGFYFSASAQQAKTISKRTVTRKDLAFLPYSALYVVNGNVAGTNKSVIKTIKPADIKRLEKLTDPSATAVYGTRGANGVVLITTTVRKTDK